MSSIGTFEVRLRRAGSVVGERSVPGDKSISHRAAILGALADGTTRISGCAGNLDCAAPLACVATLGAEVSRDGATVTVVGVGPDGFREPVERLDARNSGTTTRLLAGALAGQAVVAELTGDESL